MEKWTFVYNVRNVELSVIFYFFNVFCCMMKIIEALKKCDIELWMIKWKDRQWQPLINIITEMVKYFEKRWGKIFDEYIVGNNISWFQTFFIGIIIFSEGKIDNRLPKNIRSMIVNWIIEDKWWLKYNWTIYVFSEDQSDISFRKIADTLFGEGFSEFLKWLNKLPSVSIVSSRLKQYAVKLNSGEILDIWDVLWSLFDVFQEIEKNNKWQFNNFIKD